MAELTLKNYELANKARVISGFLRPAAPSYSVAYKSGGIGGITPEPSEGEGGNRAASIDTDESELISPIPLRKIKL